MSQPKPFFQSLKQHEKPHGVSGKPGLDVDAIKVEQVCLQAI
jgi:hypothetical protein